MKFATAVLLFLLIAVAPAASQRKQNTTRLEDEAESKTVDGFGAHLILVEQPQSLIENWTKPGTPNIKTISTAKRAEPLGVFVLFTNCLPDGTGLCDAEMDFAIYKPDGKVFASRENLELWKRKPLSPTEFQMGVASLIFRLRRTDQSGEYKIKASVRDSNRHVNFDLVTRFRVP